MWQRLRKSINNSSNHNFSIKQYNINQYDNALNNYPLKAPYLQHICNLTIGARIGLLDNYAPRLFFSVSEKMSIAQELRKWLKTGIVLGLFDENYAKRNNVTLHMLLGVPKHDASTKPILNFSDETKFNYSVNDLIDSKLCTVEYAQTKQVVETVRVSGKNGW